MAGESRAASQVQFAIVVRARRVCLCRCEGRSASLFGVCMRVYVCIGARRIESSRLLSHQAAVCTTQCSALHTGLPRASYQRQQQRRPALQQR